MPRGIGYKVTKRVKKKAKGKKVILDSVSTKKGFGLNR